MHFPLLSPSGILRRLQTDGGNRAEVFALDRDGKAEINEAAEQVVIRCDGTRTTAAIARELSSIFDQTPVEAIEVRIEQVLAPLVAQGLVLMRESPLAQPRPMPDPVPLTRALHSLQIETTYACNLHCVHCYAVAEEGASEVLDLAAICRVIDRFSRAGGAALTLTGGEALLRPDMLDIIAHAARKPLQVSLLSNGTLITRRLAGRLKDAGVAMVQISLDGHRAGVHDEYRGMPGAFESVLSAIGHLQEAGVDTGIGTVLHRDNIDHVGEIIELAARFDIEPVFSMQKAEGRALTAGRRYQISYQEAAEAQLRIHRLRSGDGGRITLGRAEMNGHRCSAGVSRLSIRPNGDIVPCMEFHGPEWVLGNVIRDDLLDVWESDHFALARLRGIRTGDVRFCRACRFRPYCDAGCPATALKTWGDLNWPDLEKCSYFAVAEAYLDFVDAME